jgi:predicted nucleotidyltransferase
MMMQKQDILNYLKSNQEYYHNQFGVQFIGLFGSFARDEANENSDIDILYKIEKDKKLSMFKYLKLTKQLEENLHKKIDLVRDETLKPQLKSYIQKDINYV